MLRIELIKQPGGAGVLRCTRSDGSITWQKQTKHAAHFALHDLTQGKSARGRIPAEALEVERIFGLFDSERGSSALRTAGEFNQFAPRTLTEASIHRVRSLHAALFRQWFAVAEGDTLELQFTNRIAQAAGRERTR